MSLGTVLLIVLLLYLVGTLINDLLMLSGVIELNVVDNNPVGVFFKLLSDIIIMAGSLIFLYLIIFHWDYITQVLVKIIG